jgi:hypothetical protein
MCDRSGRSGAAMIGGISMVEKEKKVPHEERRNES